MSSVNLAYAEEYARRGWDMAPVTIELNPHTTKKQVIFHNQWREEASHDSDKIKEWFGDEAERTHPYQGIAIATGKRSGLFVVDVDNEYYWETVVLAEEGHDLPETYTVKSQSGSTHLYFQWPEGFEGGGPKILFDKRIDEWAGDGKARGIDIREEGGVIFAPPTFVYDSETHAVAGEYKVDTSKTTVVAPLPKWILDIYLQNRIRKRGTTATGTAVRRRIPKSEHPTTWDPATAQKQLVQILDWAKEEFTTLIENPLSYWNNGVTSVMGVLVRAVNAPWFEFEENDLDKFLDDYAPRDANFGEKEWDSIKNSVKRMADDDVIMYDETADEDFLMQLGAMFTVFGEEVQEERALVTSKLATLPDEFWNARPLFSEIRTNAYAQLASADATFHSFMAAYCSQIPYQYVIESGLGTANFCYFTALVGPSGSGKGQAQSKGLKIANVVSDGQPSSGEGILEFFMGEEVDMDDPRNFDKSGVLKPDASYMTRIQTKHNVLLTFSEGSALTQLSDRQNSILNQIILSLAVGEDLSTMTATQERRRHIDGGSYAAGLIASFQMKTSALLLQQGEVGLTQRFIWSAIKDPNMPLDTVAPHTPVYMLPVPVHGPDPVVVSVDDSITKELRFERWQNGTDQIETDNLDSHRPGKLLQISGILRMLDGPNKPGNKYMITDDDWYLAKVIYDTSRKVRQQLIATVAAGKDEDLERVGREEAVKAVAKAEATTVVKNVKARQRVFDVIDRLTAKGKPTKISYITQNTSGDTRKLVSSGLLDMMVEEGTLVVSEDGVYTRAPEPTPEPEPEKAEPKKRAKK